MTTKHTRNTQRLGRLAIVTGLACAALGASADDPVKMQVYPTEAPGGRGIDNEQYARAIRLLEIVIARAKRTTRAQSLLLTNLSAAYTKVVNYETATRDFDQAIKWSLQAAVAHNDRDVVEALKHHFAAASADFEAARNRRGSAALAEHDIEQVDDQVSGFSVDSLTDISTKPNV